MVTSQSEKWANTFIDPFWEYTRADQLPLHMVHITMCGADIRCVAAGLRSWPRPLAGISWGHDDCLLASHLIITQSSLALLVRYNLCLYVECCFNVCSLDLPSNSEQCSGVLGLRMFWKSWISLPMIGARIRSGPDFTLFKCLQWGKWYTLHSLRVVFASFVSILSCCHCRYRL